MLVYWRVTLIFTLDDLEYWVGEMNCWAGRLAVLGIFSWNNRISVHISALHIQDYVGFFLRKFLTFFFVQSFNFCFYDLRYIFLIKYTCKKIKIIRVHSGYRNWQSRLSLPNTWVLKIEVRKTLILFLKINSHYKWLQKNKYVILFKSVRKFIYRKSAKFRRKINFLFTFNVL